MYKLTYDLHIHSCLSPCGSDESTPANIAGLAEILELNIVALTDHNSCKNCPAFFKAAENYNFIPIAGMELMTEEEIHVLCLFPELEAAMDFDEYVYSLLFPMKNDVNVFGKQIIMDETDKIIGEVENCLINSVSIGFHSLSGEVKSRGGLIIPAHIERAAFSLISSLGFVPDDCGFDCVEIRSKEAVDNLKKQHEYLQKCRVVHNSDAHVLEDMSLPENRLVVAQRNAGGVLSALKT
ncbi:MAG: PHP domain-containing protein [Oscillospiraceae bacterium]|jgi:PHP family Zn ribbon phosphoesterase|nr:PHP domain-containing protein [Oscillospiraceae bacterium]